MPDEKKNRCYDNGGCPYKKQIEGAMPMKIYLATIAVLVIFAGWHVASLKALDHKYDARITAQDIKYYDRISDFYRIAQDNKELLMGVDSKIDVFGVKQEVIKLDIQELKIGFTKTKERFREFEKHSYD